jgi:hypothetical protein
MGQGLEIWTMKIVKEYYNQTFIYNPDLVYLPLGAGVKQW